MDLYLIRHAEAVPLGEDGITDDAERPLTLLGREQSARLGALFGRLNVRFDSVVSSPLVRARETAFLMLPALAEPTPRLIEEDEVGFEMRPRRMARILERLAQPTLAVVGHQPTLGTFLAWLIGSKKAHLEMAKAGVAMLEVEEFRKGGAALRWLVTPEWF